MAELPARLPQSLEAVQAEIERVQGQLLQLRQTQRPQQQRSEGRSRLGKKRRQASAAAVTAAPAAAAAPLPPPAAASAAASALLAEIGAVESLLSAEYSREYAARFDSAHSMPEVEAEMSRIQQEMQRHQQQQQSGSGHTPSKRRRKGG